MADYYLYLDESGQFAEVSNRGLPSIIAGFLSEKKCTEAQAKGLLVGTKRQSDSFSAIDIEHFHAMKNANSSLYEFITVLLEKMSKEKFQFVVFKNDKEYSSINSDVTYLNVFAEGIVNLLHFLLAQTNDEIFLHVCYASRLNVAERDSHGIYLSLDEKSYLERIEERIDWRMLRLKSSERKRIKKNFVVNKADFFAPLMLADAVCYALRSGWKKLTPDLKVRIKKLPTLTFRLPEKISWREIQNLLIENRIGEAIYSWYVHGNSALFDEYDKQFINTVINKLKSLGSSSRKFQYDATAQLVGTLVDARDFDTVKKFTDLLDAKIFPLLRENNLNAQEFFFDIHFYRLTVATHEGNTFEEQREIGLCREILPTLPATFEKLDYFLKYKLREVEYLKNTYDFERALKELNRLEKILSNTSELLNLIDDLDDFAKDIRSTTLGKVIGSRAVTKIYLSTTKPDLIASAREDLVKSVEQFFDTSDKARQFQSFSMLETVAGNFQESLSWLGKAFAVNEKPSPASVLLAIKNFAGLKTFGLLHYANLMTAAMTARNALGRELFDTWISLNAEDFLKDSSQYPVPIILWRAGKCRALLGQKTAKNFYDNAIKFLLGNPASLTLFVEGLIIEADKFATLDESSTPKFLRKIQEDYQKFSSLPVPKSMRATFAEWEKIDDVANKFSVTKLRDFFANLVKKIPVI